LRHIAIVVVMTGMIACGDSDDGSSNSGGNPLVPSGSGQGPSGATITITGGGVNPGSVSITNGQSVTFVNNDTRPHEIASDPHPVHTNCPSINALGTIPAGVTRLTNAFGGSGTCGFHDHGDPNNASLKGTITVR
jgi:plastocyanin